VFVFVFVYVFVLLVCVCLAQQLQYFVCTVDETAEVDKELCYKYLNDDA
jgi:hypothetical protein